MKKLGRNEPCPCGSSKKYKNCCLRKDNEKNISPFEKNIKKLTSEKCCYLAPNKLGIECSKNIVAAHTISKSRQLKAIAEDGEVMGLERIQRDLPLMAFKKIGVKSASTFKGFCGNHDKEVFKHIEDKPFEGTPEQISLLSYRLLCKEHYIKNAAIREFSPLNVLGGLLEGSELGIRDLNYLKDKIEQSISSKNFDIFTSYIFELQNIPNFVTSSCCAPLYCFNNKKLQELGGDKPSYIFYNCIQANKKGYIIFTWLKEDEQIIEQFLSSLIDKRKDHEIENGLCGFFFSYGHNIFLRPSWWDKLSDEFRGKIIRRTKDGMFIYGLPFSYTPLIDGSDYNAFKIKKHYKLT